ncbi:MAG: BatA domain-containing protein [Bacteroidota bacterium]
MLFAYPSFLFALSALIIPIIIHLFQLRRYKKVVFSDIRFLKQITEQNQKQRNIKDWIILAARCLAIACLVLAFAKPFIPFNKINPIANKDKAISIFVDNSFSMSQQNNEGQLLEVAKNKAKEIASFYHDNDNFQLLSNDFEGKHQQQVNKKDFMQLVDELTISNQSKNINQIIAKQKQQFENSAGSNKIAYIVSDLQQNQFEHLNEIDSSIQTNFVQIKPNQNNNISIDSAWVEQPLILPNTPTNLFVKISNYGKLDITDVPLTFKIDGVQKGIANVSCKANTNHTIQLQFSLNDVQYHQAELSVLDNPVIFDDKLFLSLKAFGNKNVLAINSNSSIQNVFAIDKNYTLINNTEKAIDYSQFNQASLIIVNEVSNMPTGFQNELQKYLNDGGIVLFIPSSNAVNLAQTNTFLQQLNAPQYGPKTTQNIKVTRINMFDDVFKNVFSKIPEQANWPALTNFYPLQITSNIKGYAVATLNNDMPFIFKSKYGKGYMYTMSTPLQSEWSNFTSHALFVPFMLRLPLVNKQSANLYYNIGKPFTYVFDKNTNNKVVYVKNNKEEIAFDINNNTSHSSITIDNIKHAGNYTLMDQNKKEQLGSVSFNTNRNESDLSIASIDTKNNMALLQTNELLKHQKQIDLAYNGTQLWRWFLLAAFLFIVIELLLLKWKV